MSEPQTFTPKEYGKRLGVSEIKVLRWIHSGELAAVNVAASLKNRPRWRITTEAIAAFEAARTAKPAEAKPPRRRPSYRQFV